MRIRGRALLGLLSSWVAWWAILAAWKIGPALPAIYRVSREGAKGSANVSFGDGGFSATIAEAGKVTWEGHISFIALVLLVGVPPIILWALWVSLHSRSGSPGLIREGVPSADSHRDAERVKKER